LGSRNVIGHVTIRLPEVDFQWVVYGNHASIWHRYRDMAPQMLDALTLTGKEKKKGKRKRKAKGKEKGEWKGKRKEKREGKEEGKGKGKVMGKKKSWKMRRKEKRE